MLGEGEILNKSVEYRFGLKLVSLYKIPLEINMFYQLQISDECGQV